MTGASAAAGAGQGRSASASPVAGLQPRRELAALLLLGAAGAGLVLVALRQEWARVTLLAPRPLPAAVVGLTGQDLLPSAAALALAALASLAAVVATRRALRRITGLITAGLGGWVAVLVIGRVSAAGVLAAARRTAAAAGSGSGTAAGSVTAGGGPAGAGGAGRSVAGFPAHVLLAASGWRALVLCGALAIVAAGLAVVLRAGRLPVMSARYDRPLLAAGAGRGALVARPGETARTSRSADAASIWDSLTAGTDPTAGPGPDTG